MKTLNTVTSACRYCRYYKPEGRRGGLCQQLGVPVRGAWGACSLALPAFAPSWERLEVMMRWQEETVKTPEALSFKCSLNSSQESASHEENVSTAQQPVEEEALLV